MKWILPILLITGEYMDLVEVACGLILDDDKVFICRRKPEKSLGGYWEFPGGKVEAGETGEVCLARELKEELGMAVEVGELFMVNDHKYEHIYIRLRAYVCELSLFDGVLRDHDDFAWVSISDVSHWRLAPADIPIAEALRFRGRPTLNVR